MKISTLRTELGLSQAEFATLLGLASKGNVSIIERENRCGLRIAVAIEALSQGRIDAATLCDEVRLARETVHVAADTAAQQAASPDSPAQNMGEAA